METKLYQCDRCLAFVDDGFLGWTPQTRKARRDWNGLWHISVTTCVSRIQALNAQWCSDCVQSQYPDLDLAKHLKEDVRG